MNEIINQNPDIYIEKEWYFDQEEENGMGHEACEGGEGERLLTPEHRSTLRNPEIEYRQDYLHRDENGRYPQILFLNAWGFDSTSSLNTGGVGIDSQFSTPEKYNQDQGEDFELFTDFSFDTNATSFQFNFREY
jgi:hypothetical protein